MATVLPGRFTAEHNDDFVVFVIGVRLNRPWKLRKWLPVFLAMPKMLRELVQHPEKGLLGYSQGLINGGPAVVQYWRSFDDLDRFARNPDDPHLPAWRRFNAAIGASGDVGIWHETYRVAAGQYEAVYANMPVVGLASATSHRPAGTRGHTAARRIGLAAADNPAVPPYENP
jgi:Monooxygenase af470-like